MFSRHRHRSYSNPPKNTTPNSNAALAASQAFLKDRASNASLSNAAATAALRSFTTSPTAVADIQTKRMIRRGSTSSQGSADARGQSNRGLVRQSSSGSMTERTFRSPSPNRKGSPSIDPNAPPVPAIPKNVPSKSHRRTASLEPPFRVTSPGPKKQGGRGVSVDRGTIQMHAARVTNLSQVPEVDRENSQRSINFSRPISPQSSSPSPVSPRQNQKGGWFSSPAVSDQPPRAGPPGPPQPNGGILAVDTSNSGQEVINAAEKPVTKKKKKAVDGIPGSHLAEGHLAGKPRGTALESTTGAQSQRPMSPSKDLTLQGSRHAIKPALRPTSPVERPQSPDTDRPRGFQTRAAGLLFKQPSTVREDREREELEDNITSANTSRKIDGLSTSTNSEVTHSTPLKSVSAQAPNGRQPDTQVVTPASKGPASALRPSTSKGSVRSERPASLSPARAAHFAEAVLELPGVIHHPPPRSISPAKSALKYSPSSSSRTASPVTGFGVGRGRQGSIDASSDDGTRIGPKKKKNVRVSFDEVTTMQSVPDVPGSLGSNHSATLGNAAEDDYENEGMKPRPALPSFGSIRGRSTREEESAPEKVTETIPSSMSTSASTLPDRTGASNDHALARIITQDFTAKQEGQTQQHSNEPLPPEVTSVEGSGYVSDTDSAYSDENVAVPVAKPATELAPVEAQETTSQVLATEHKEHQLPGIDEHMVPTLSIQPPTPAPEERIHELTFTMPGGFPDFSPEWDKESISDKNSAIRKGPSLDTPSAAKSTTMETPVAPKSTPSISFGATSIHQYEQVNQDSSSEDGDSIYSDAEEDLSHLDEGGFASLDAIVESPLVAPVRPFALSSPPDSPSIAQRSQRLNDTDTSPVASNEDWNLTKAYWNGLSEQKREQIEREASPHYESTPTKKITETKAVSPTSLAEQPTVLASKPRKKKQPQSRIDTEEVVSNPPQPAPAKTRQAQKQPLKSSMRSTAEESRPETRIRKSMRGAPDVARSKEPPRGEAHMRRSMRDEEASLSQRSDTTMRQSMRNHENVRRSVGSAPQGLAASRHAIQPTPTSPKEPRGALQKKNLPPAAALKPSLKNTGSPVANKRSSMPPLSRTFSNDSSASESSFRKRRKSRTSIGADGRYAMRRSMRGASQPSMSIDRPISPTPTRPKSSRFSVRSLSPIGSTTGGGGMRSTMRGSIDAGPTLRNRALPPSKPMFGGFGKTKAKSGPSKSSGGYRSRFADSSDEEDARPTYRSRFDDSDEDDDSPLKLTPVRPIPRRRGEEDGDSTDLEDSDDETTVRRARNIEKASAVSGLTNGKPAGGALASGTMRTDTQPGINDAPVKKEKKKRGFLGFGKKKGKKEPGTLDISTESARPVTPQGETGSSITAVNSAGKTQDYGSPASPSSPIRMPKLQRRITPQNQMQRIMSDTWPLPTPIEDDGRPATSDGATMLGKASRPSLGNRKSTAPTVMGDEEGKHVAYGRSGKKKKFMGLRRVFGLDN